MSPAAQVFHGAVLAFAIVYAPTVPTCISLMTDTKFVGRNERLVHTLIFLVWCTCVCAAVLHIVYLLSGEVAK